MDWNEGNPFGVQVHNIAYLSSYVKWTHIVCLAIMWTVLVPTSNKKKDNIKTTQTVLTMTFLRGNLSYFSLPRQPTCV